MKLVYLDVGPEVLIEAFAIEFYSPEKRLEVRLAALKDMEIEYDEDDIPLASYLKHLHAINDIPYQVPPHPDVVEAILANKYASVTTLLLF